MDNFKAIYKILSALEKAMDSPEFDMTLIGAEHLGISQERWKRYIEMLFYAGYIDGVVITRYCTGDSVVRADDMRITLKGLEYLLENPIMCKARKEIEDI